MIKDKRTEAEIFSILYHTINGADLDDLYEAVYKIVDEAGYHKRDTESETRVVFDDSNVYIRIGNAGYVTTKGHFEEIIKAAFPPVE